MIKRIIARMARFRDMRRFAEVVKNHNDNERNDPDMVAFAGDDDWLLKINREEAQKQYQDKYNVSSITSQEVYEDVVSKPFGYVNVESTPISEKCLWVGSKGRNLLKKGGLFKEYAKHNKDFLHLLLAFIGGLVGGVGVVVAILNL